MSAHPSVPPGTLLGGKFRIERLLGAGAMGTVYAIDHELTRHKRALKLLHPAVQGIPDIVRRFLNEASAAGRAGNPHLVETFDAGTLPSGEPYVVMELLEGETLGAVLDRERTLAPSLAAELVAQAAEGMAAAHRAGIIHRDLKPENLFVTLRDGAPFIKIMDFGVSKFATGTSSGMSGTRAGALYGSPVYMSPEQLTARVDVDGRTDVFALGVVLYQCLTGVLPFDAATIEVLLLKLLKSDLVPVESVRPGLPAGLGRVVHQALATDRDERFASAGALVDALSTFRALPAPALPEDIALAATLASGPPSLAILRPSGPISLPAGVPRRRRALLPIAGITATLLALAAALAVASSTPATLPSLHTGPPLTGAAAAPSPPTAFATAVASASVGSSAPSAERSGRPSDPPRAPLAPASSMAPATALQPSKAQDLGLREDNPFR